MKITIDYLTLQSLTLKIKFYGQKRFFIPSGYRGCWFSFFGLFGKLFQRIGGQFCTFNVDFTLDLTTPSNAALLATGGFVIANGIIVAKTVSGNYIAVSSACTHEGTNVQYVKGSDHFYCPNHGAQFSTTGAVVSGPTNRALTAYKVSLSGTLLRIYS